MSNVYNYNSDSMSYIKFYISIMYEVYFLFVWSIFSFSVGLCFSGLFTIKYSQKKSSTLIVFFIWKEWDNVVSCILDVYCRSHSNKYPHLFLSQVLKGVLQNFLSFLFVTSISWNYHVVKKMWQTPTVWLILSPCAFFLLVVHGGYPCKMLALLACYFQVIF